jgi:hypothetical protein
MLNDIYMKKFKDSITKILILLKTGLAIYTICLQIAYYILKDIFSLHL